MLCLIVGRHCSKDKNHGFITAHCSMYVQGFIMNQGGVAHIYTVGRSATAVKLNVNSQFEIFSKVNGQATAFL